MNYFRSKVYLLPGINMCWAVFLWMTYTTRVMGNITISLLGIEQK